LLAALPVTTFEDYASPAFEEYAEVFKGLRLLTLAHVVKTWRLKRMAVGFNLNMHPFAATLSAWFLFATIFLHWITCAVCFVWLETASSPDMAVDENSVDTPTEHILDFVLNPLFMDNFAATPEYYQPGHPYNAVRLYVRAWRVAQGFLMSHGHFLGNSWREDLLSCIASISGSLLYKGFVAMGLAMVIRTLQNRSTSKGKQLQKLEECFRKWDVPPHLRMRARLYMEVNRSLNTDVFEDTRFKAGSASALETDLQHSLYSAAPGVIGRYDHEHKAKLQPGCSAKIRRILRKDIDVINLYRAVPFFKNADSATFFTLLSEALDHEVFAKHDTVEQRGEVAQRLFMIEQGFLLRFYPAAVEQELYKGSFWGEHALLATHIVENQVVALSPGGIPHFHERALHLYKRALFPCERALHLYKRDLYPRRTALYTRACHMQPTLLTAKLLLSLSAVSYVSEKEPYICAKEPYIFSKDLGIPAHETCTMASVSH